MKVAFFVFSFSRLYLYLFVRKSEEIGNLICWVSVEVLNLKGKVFVYFKLKFKLQFINYRVNCY